MIVSTKNEITGKIKRSDIKPVHLIMDNVFLEVRYASNDIEFKLWETLSFTIQDFNPNTPPVTRHLFNRKTKKTYAGLLLYVEEILNNNNIEYVFIDKRIAWEENAEFHLVKYLDEAKTIELKARDYQQKIIDNCNPREIIQAATSSGKALPLDTNILTPTGWKKMHDIHIGDIVYDEDGKATEVINEYYQGMKDVYEITFKDNSKIECCEDHLWKVTLYNSNFAQYKVLSLFDIYWHYQIKNYKGIYQLAIPINKAIQFEKKQLEYDPYIIGILINTDYINIDNNILFTSILNQKAINNIDNKYLLSIFNQMQNINLQDYLMSSTDDRLKMLQGLIAAYGIINKGKLFIPLINIKKYKDIKFLIQSLGYRCELNDNNIYISHIDLKLFVLDEHKYCFKNQYYNVLEIINIKKLHMQKEMKCIAVDSPQHTYICENFIVTHNTFIMAGLIAKFNVKPVSIFADKISLCMQLKNEFEKFLGEPVGLVGGGYKDIKDITVYSVQSTTEEMVKDTKLLMVDECHHQACDTFSQVSRWCSNAYYRIGVSATPWRDDGSDLLIDACFTKKDPAKVISASLLINKGYLTPCTIYWITQPQIFKSKNYNTLYRDAIIMNNERNKNIVNIATQLRKRRDATILILIQRIEHGEILLRMLKEYIPCKSFFMEIFNKAKKKTLVRINEIEMISGEDPQPKREAILQALREKKTHIVLGTTVFDEGISVDSIDTVILAGAGRSSTRAYQRIGRGLRLYPGKNKCIIIDFWDKTEIFLRQARARNKMYKAEEAFDIQNFPTHLLNKMPPKLY